MRISVRPGTTIIHSLGFSRIIGSIPDATQMRRSSRLSSLSLNDSIPGSQLFPELPTTSPSSFALPLYQHYHGNSKRLTPPGIARQYWLSDAWFRNINLIPFRRLRRSIMCEHITYKTSPITQRVSFCLGPTNPRPTAVHEEPFSTSA
ncbi:hypothetical protein RF11_15299 [Thelohanellus kitauei]|uniref:Uncharacterized protein n=1 Tax=Thelohanellus kitauei TaxID=669202 RepID=A0A0C2MYL1_THEKT|nr:hypothetical protein RF11_15299 [Thelohanellus kitauei]